MHCYAACPYSVSRVKLYCVVVGLAECVSTTMLGDGQSDPIAISGDDVNEILIGSRPSFEDAY